ncbi:MAG: hypothetical protein NWR72_18205 [Bacteroidia bacterium]|nr:hypothetical protein [Bacteroidia bacterium]
MKTRKVQELIRALEQHETQRFIDWLTWDLAGKQESTLILARQMLADQPIEQIWTALHPHKGVPANPYADSGLRRVESQLVGKLEEFFAIEAFRQDEANRHMKLLEALNRRQATHSFEDRYQKVVAQADHLPLPDEQYHHFRYRIERERRAFLLKSGKKDKLPGNLTTLNLHAEMWWIHEKLRIALISLARNNQSDSFGLLLIDEILALLRTFPDLTSFPLLIIYQDLLILLRDNDISLAPQIQDWLYAKQDLLSTDIVQDIYAILHNRFLRLYHQDGDLCYAHSLWNLYQWAVSNDLLLLDGVLPPVRYRNLLGMGLVVGEKSLVFEYLHKLKRLLPKSCREEESRFNLGSYYSATGEPDLAIRIFAQKFTDPFLEVSARIKLLRLRYQCRGERDFEGELRSLEEYLCRHEEIRPEIKKHLYHEVKLFRQLLKAFTEPQRARLVSKAKMIQPFSSRAWYLDQLKVQPEKFAF